MLGPTTRNVLQERPGPGVSNRLKAATDVLDRLGADTIVEQAEGAASDR